MTLKHIKPARRSENLRLFYQNILENFVKLSVDLHNLNANIQKKYRISLAQWLVLRKIIDFPGLSASKLAEETGVHASTLTPTLGRLESAGLIHIQERSNDVRRKLILASRDGFELCNQTEIYLCSILQGQMEIQGYQARLQDIRFMTKQMAARIDEQNIQTHVS